MLSQLESRRARFRRWLMPLLFTSPSCVSFGYIYRRRRELEVDEAADRHISLCRRCSLVEHVWRDLAIALNPKHPSGYYHAVKPFVYLPRASTQRAEEYANRIYHRLQGGFKPNHTDPLDHFGLDQVVALFEKNNDQRFILDLVERIRRRDQSQDDPEAIEEATAYDRPQQTFTHWLRRRPDGCPEVQPLFALAFGLPGCDDPDATRSHIDKCDHCSFIFSALERLNSAMEHNLDLLVIETVAEILAWNQIQLEKL